MCLFRVARQRAKLALVLQVFNHFLVTLDVGSPYKFFVVLNERAQFIKD